MGHTNRTMTRQSKTQRTFIKTRQSKDTDNKSTASANVKLADLKLIKLTEDQEKNTKLKFVYDLPQTLKDLKTLLKNQSEEE